MTTRSGSAFRRAQALSEVIEEDPPISSAKTLYKARACIEQGFERFYVDARAAGECVLAEPAEQAIIGDAVGGAFHCVAASRQAFT